MSIPLLGWRVHLRSLYNASRYDTKMSVAFGVVAIVNIALALWLIQQLTTLLHMWIAQGPFATTTGLWSVCLQTWAGMAFFAVIGIQQALSSDKALLLLTLPIPRAARFRMLFGSFFLENIGVWFLLQAVVMAYTLISTLGWQAVSWLVLLQVGIFVCIFVVLITTLLLLYAFIMRTYAALGLVAVALFVFISLLLLMVVNRTLSLQRLAYSMSPTFVSIAFVGGLIAALGPLAGCCGGLYEATFYAMQGRDHAGSRFTLPGLRLLSGLAQRQRTLVGALWYKALLNQSRNWLFWARIVVTLVVISLFPLLHSAISPYHIPNNTFVVWFAAGVALLHALETAVNAISGEASRLALYITAPLTLARFLRAKLLLFGLPSCIEGVALGLFLCWRFELPISQTGPIIAVIALIVTATLSWLVIGSAWDEDINLAVEGPAQALMQEEMPFSPRRLWLLNSCVVLYVALGAAVWKLPLLFVIPLLASLDIVIIFGIGYWSYRQLGSLLR